MSKKNSIKRHPLLLSAKLISNIFHPTYYPLVGLAILFFSAYRRLSWDPFGLASIAYVLSVTALFTIFLPRLLIRLYRMAFSIAPHRLLLRHERFTPYVLHLLCYLFLLHLLHTWNAQGSTLAVVIVSILIQICCTLINCFWKISMHAAGAGAAIGFTVSHGTMFGVNPLVPVIITIVMCGLVCTSRLILRRHTLAQVNVGALVGILCGIAGTLLSSFRGIF